MAICVKCGKDTNSCLCESCKQETDIEELCFNIISFRPGTGENELWEQICAPLQFQEHRICPKL